ncbi:hypothetical protein NYA30BAC_00835 [Halomonas sp. NYA30]
MTGTGKLEQITSCFLNTQLFAFLTFLLSPVFQIFCQHVFILHQTVELMDRRATPRSPAKTTTGLGVPRLNRALGRVSTFPVSDQSTA